MSLSLFLFLRSTTSLQLRRRSNIVSKVTASQKFVMETSGTRSRVSTHWEHGTQNTITLPMPTNAEIAILSQQRNQVLWCKSPIWKRARTTIAFCHFSARRFDSFCEFRVFRFPLTLFDILRIWCLFLNIHTVSYTHTHTNEKQRIPSDVAGICSSSIDSIMCRLTNILVGCVWIGVHSNISLSRHCFSFDWLKNNGPIHEINQCHFYTAEREKSPHTNYRFTDEIYSLWFCSTASQKTKPKKENWR